MSRIKREKFEVTVTGKKGETFTRVVTARNNVEAISQAMTHVPLYVITVRIEVNGEVIYQDTETGGQNESNGRVGRPYAFKSNVWYNVGMTTSRMLRYHVKEDYGDFVDAAIREKLKRDLGVEI